MNDDQARKQLISTAQEVLAANAGDLDTATQVMVDRAKRDGGHLLEGLAQWFLEQFGKVPETPEEMEAFETWVRERAEQELRDHGNPFHKH